MNVNIIPDNETFKPFIVEIKVKDKDDLEALKLLCRNPGVVTKSLYSASSISPLSYNINNIHNLLSIIYSGIKDK